jgi:hypothetical protein
MRSDNVLDVYRLPLLDFYLGLNDLMIIVELSFKPAGSDRQMQDGGVSAKKLLLLSHCHQQKFYDFRFKLL